MTFIWPQRQREIEDSGEPRQRWTLSGRVAAALNTPVILMPPPCSLADPPNLASGSWAHFLSLDVPQPLLEDPFVFLSVSCMHFAAGVKTPPKDWAAPSQHGSGGNAPATGQKPVTGVPCSLRTPPDEPPPADQGQNYLFYLLLGSEQMSC